MLKELVRERLVAAADEIFGLFERTIMSYEEQLCRARAETERHRRQLEAVCETQTVLHNEDVRQLIGHREEFSPHPLWGSSSLEHLQPFHNKEEEKDPQPCHIKEEEEEAVVSKFPLTVVSVESQHSEDKAPEWTQLHHHSPSGDHRGGPPTAQLFGPLSQNDDMEDTHDTDREGEQSGCEKETTLNKKTSETGRRLHAHKEHLHCSVCHQRFSYESTLKLHMQTHTGDKRFNCLVCGETFARKGNMNVHMKKHTGEKAFCCAVCGRCFTRKENWTIHMRTHTGEKPFRCSVCGKTFLHKSNMVTHMRTHTGEKPFSCSICDKSFSYKSDLNRHMRTHTGEKPFSCSVCHKSFSCKSDLNRHVRTHTGKNA